MAEIHLDPEVLSDLQEVMESEYPTLLDTFIEDSQERASQHCARLGATPKRWDGLPTVSKAAAAI